MSAALAFSAGGLEQFLRGYGRARLAEADGRGLQQFLNGYRLARRPRPTAESLRALVERLAPAARAARARGDHIDLWSVAGLRRHEVRTAAVLAWVLDPHGSHGQGEAVSRALWAGLNAQAVFGFPVEGVRRVVTELCPLGDLSDRIDLVLEGDDFVLLLEVKIDAGLQPDQIGRYQQAARRKAAALGKAHGVVAYLAQTAGALPRGVLHLRWRDVGRAVEQAVRGMEEPECFSAQVLKQFGRHVSRLH